MSVRLLAEMIMGYLAIATGSRMATAAPVASTTGMLLLRQCPEKTWWAG
jgi:hypothetical protein